MDSINKNTENEVNQLTEMYNELKNKTVDNTIKEDSIVWVESSNLSINCGKIISFDINKRTANVFNYDGWTTWTVSFDEIVRVGVSYYTDKYRDWSHPRVNDVIIRYEREMVRPLEENEYPSFHNIGTKSFKEISMASLVIFYKKNGECHIIKNRQGTQGIVVDGSRYKKLLDIEKKYNQRWYNRILNKILWKKH